MLAGLQGMARLILDEVMSDGTRDIRSPMLVGMPGGR